MLKTVPASLFAIAHVRFWLGPAGWPQQVTDATAPRPGPPHVAQHPAELVEIHRDRIIAADVLGKSVANRLGLLGVAAENSVPDDEDAAVVLVEVGVVGAVMDPVV